MICSIRRLSCISPILSLIFTLSTVSTCSANAILGLFRPTQPESGICTWVGISGLLCILPVSGTTVAAFFPVPLIPRMHTSHQEADETVRHPIETGRHEFYRHADPALCLFYQSLFNCTFSQNLISVSLCCFLFQKLLFFRMRIYGCIRVLLYLFFIY